MPGHQSGGVAIDLKWWGCDPILEKGLTLHHLAAESSESV
jgi:hypothetical protein